jgi:PAS domain S-box-containing protein
MAVHDDQTRVQTDLMDQRFQLLINAVTDYAIYMLEPDGTVASWNPGARRFKGYEAEEILGRNFSLFFTEEDRIAGLPQQALAAAAREGRFEAEGVRLRKDGSRFWVNAVIDPIRDEAGNLLGFAKITRDITERRAAQEELEQARAELFQSQKLQALGELTGGIAHDFNNLLTVIRGSAELLRTEGLAEARRKRYLEAIIETADRATNLTSHLLAFGRRQPLKPEAIDLNLRLDAFVEMVSRTIGSQIEICLDLGPELWPVEVDATQLENALLNAAINARDAMPRGGRLTIAACNVPGEEGAADMVCVSLVDSGEGMSKEVLERVFDPFFTTKPVGKGTGLGLSQIHGFAAQSGGRAEIASIVGEGTTLRLFLPRAMGVAAGAPRCETGLAKGDGATVLLVEDNDQVRAFAESLLADLDYRVVSAASAEEALKALDGQEVDLLFSDVMMPGMSGLELAECARALRPDLPVLLASGYSEEMAGRAAAAFETLAKPYGAATLGAALAAARTRA